MVVRPQEGSGRGAEVQLRGVGYRYQAKAREVRVLHGLDLDVLPGGYVALMGSSGSGKSTVLSLVGGLERPQTGEVLVDGVDLGKLSGNALATYRRRTIGFVFQHFGLLDTLTALENVELAMALDGRPPLARRERARELLRSVGLSRREEHRPHALSGGERQRVAIARALANNPRLLLADEPTGNLDAEASRTVMDLLSALRSNLDCSLLVVTHSTLVAREADICYELVNGSLGAS